jgi:pimeloyl-ACP methyl ester carboxylesterase
MNDQLAEHVKTRFIADETTAFAYRITGHGLPLILFQRFRGTMDEWDPAFIDQLAKQNQVILFDNVGIGLTEGYTPDTLEKIADDARRFITLLGLQKVSILGWSIGGLLAQVFILRHSELVTKVILVGTGPSGSAETVFPAQRFMNAAKIQDTTPELHQMLFFTENEFGKNEALASLQRINNRKSDLSVATKQENWMNQLLAARSFFTNPGNYFDQLKNINQPVLVAGAKQDIAFPMIDSYLLAREIPNSRLIIYSNAAHAFHHQYFEHFGNVVNEFLRAD